MKSALKEGERLDKTLSLAEEIIQLGNQSSQGMQGQSEKLKKTQRTLKRIQESSIPGLDKLLGLIKKADLRNTIVIALVIAMCLAFLIYYHGFSYLATQTGGQ